MALATRAIFSGRVAPVEKTEVRLLLDSELTERVKDMKVKLKTNTGCYFSLSQICALAIDDALKQAEKELRRSEMSGDQLTML